MPNVVITFDPDSGMYYVDQTEKGVEYDPEYQVVMDMKASTYREYVRAVRRYHNAVDAAGRFFHEGKIRGREFRER